MFIVVDHTDTTDEIDNYLEAESVEAHLRAKFH